jgi:hypothetical protein
LYLVAPRLRSYDEGTAVCFPLVIVHHLLIAPSVAKSVEFLLDSVEAVFAGLFEETCADHGREEYVEDGIAPSLPSITNGLHTEIINNHRIDSQQWQ